MGHRTVGELHHLWSGGVSVVVDAGGPGFPRLLHWGAGLGELDADDLLAMAAAAEPARAGSVLDERARTSLLPLPADGWTGTPALVGRALSEDAGAALSPRFEAAHASAMTAPTHEERLRITARDLDSGLELATDLELMTSGLVRLRHAVRRLPNESGAYELSSLLVLLPLPGAAVEVLDLTGRWAHERVPQRHPLRQGTWRREGRHGRTGHDAPLLMIAGTPGFGFRRGEVRGVHVAWSGDHVMLVEHQATGARSIGGGELLGPGEVVLEPGQRYRTPWVYGSWSDAGMDLMSARVHDWLRERVTHPSTPRPVTLNTWEAVYFDQSYDRLAALAEVAADIGVERFVLDDGWFGGRRDDSAGLGDWTASAQVWPDGLGPLIDHVTGLGMQFGLWVEPEMVNEDSDLYRAHPDWVLSPPGRLPLQWRHQQVLDLANPEVYTYLLERLDAVLTEHDIAALKWDHNRDLVEAVHAGRPAVHQQTVALYHLLDALRARHPGVEIESCSSGGGRIDLEILARTDRVWPSDSNDALERAQVQLWTGLLVPPELVGTHIGAPTAHTTGRTHQLDFRATVALFGHAGLEWDLGGLGPGERDHLRSWVALYRELRPLLHSGRVVRADLADKGVLLHGVVAHDGSAAVFSYTVVATGPDAVPPAVPLPGLDATRRYRVRIELRAGGAWTSHTAPPPWTLEGVVLPGSVLGTVGLPLPLLMPEHALLLRLDEVAP